jgi:hypothetical protein
MSGYTVTITPAGDQSGPQTTIQVDTSSGAARVVELTVRAAGVDGLAPQQLPVIDLAGLIAALVPPTAHAITAETHTPAATAPAPAPEAEPTSQRRTRAPRGSRTEASRAEAPAAPRKRATKARATESAGPRKSTSTRGRRRQAAEAAAEPGSGRAYRRMPDQDEVVAAWQQSGSVSALAQHFGVPRHTATGWLRRLRGLGVLESKS